MKKGILGFVFAVMIFGLSSVSSFAATGTVTAGSAKVREKASADSTVVASTSKGTKVDIVGAEKDSSGTVWYKVPVSGGSYGYVRSDLVETSDTISVTDNSQSSSSSSSKPEATVPTAIGEQAATVSCDTNVTVRSGASTKHDAVTSLPNGTEITLIGEANDSSGNKWYQLRCEYNGKTIEGYIRSDLIEIASGSSSDSTESTDAAGDGTEGTDAETTDGTEGTDQEGITEGDTEEEVVEEPVEEEHNDYEVVYMEDTENPGTGTYYLYNNIDGTMADVEVLFSTVTTANDNISKLESEASQKNILIIVLAAVVVVLLIVMTILIIKLKGAYEYEYDDDDDEEEDEEEFEEPEPRRVRRRVQEEVEEEERPRRQERSPRASRSEEQERPVRRERVREENSERKPRTSGEGESTVRKPARKSQNFLADDDEFEFEFLNMDDKDL